MVAYGLYAAATTAAYALAFLIRFELRLPSAHLQTFLLTLPFLVGIRLVSHALFRLATGRWRYAGMSDLFRLLGSSALGTAVFVAVLAGLSPVPAVPKSVVLIEMVLTTYLTGGIWFAYRLVFQGVRRRARVSEGGVKRVIVIGAGEAGSRLAHQMVTFASGYDPVAFVDDDPLQWGTHVHGIEVVGAIRDVAAIVREYKPDELITALPSLDPSGLRRVVALCEPTGLPIKVLPAIAEVFGGNVRLNQLREVQVEDLLGRDPVDLALPELAEDFRDHTVLITGPRGRSGRSSPGRWRGTARESSSCWTWQRARSTSSSSSCASDFRRSRSTRSWATCWTTRWWRRTSRSRPSTGSFTPLPASTSP